MVMASQYNMELKSLDGRLYSVDFSSNYNLIKKENLKKTNRLPFIGKLHH